MNNLEKYTDEELLAIHNLDIESELKNRGYEYGWHKKVHYAGAIYILVNPAFPDLVKIGYADNVESRVKTLNRNSGLPDPFHVYAIYKVKKRLEDLKLHSLIDSLDSTLRHSKNKEFYEMSPEKAFEILYAIAQINGDDELIVKNPLQDDFFNPPTREPEGLPPQRGKLTFKMLKIPVGSVLTYAEDPSILVKTVDENSKVILDGQVYTLSGAVKKLKNGGNWQGGYHFRYNGKRLTEIRKEIEKANKEGMNTNDVQRI